MLICWCKCWKFMLHFLLKVVMWQKFISASCSENCISWNPLRTYYFIILKLWESQPTSYCTNRVHHIAKFYEWCVKNITSVAPQFSCLCCVTPAVVFLQFNSCLVDCKSIYLQWPASRAHACKLSNLSHILVRNSMQCVGCLSSCYRVAGGKLKVLLRTPVMCISEY